MSGFDSEIVEDCCKALEAKAAAGWLLSAQHVRPLMQQARLMLDRLQVDPGGSDLIDAHECAIELLRHRAETAEAELAAAREAHAETERWFRDKIRVLEEQNDALGDANEAQVQRDEALAECAILREDLDSYRDLNVRRIEKEVAIQEVLRGAEMYDPYANGVENVRRLVNKYGAAREELKQAIHPDTVRVVANVDGHHPLVSTYLTGDEVDLLRWLAARIAEQPFVQARTPMYGMALEVLDKVAKRHG